VIDRGMKNEDEGNINIVSDCLSSNIISGFIFKVIQHTKYSFVAKKYS